MAVVDHFKNATDATLYPAGTVIYEVGDPDNVMYAVQTGEVDILFNGQVLETVGPGGILGEKSLIDDNPHTTSAIAKTDARIVLVPEDRFLFLVHETPTFAIQVMRVMASRTRAIMMRTLG